MGLRQEVLKEIALTKFKEHKHIKISLPELEKSNYYDIVLETYKLLGGQLNSLPIKYGPWDISTYNFIIELDEERHFNRYRLQTLNSDIYKNNYLGFSVKAYKNYCESFENECTKAASWGKNWKNDSTEKMFNKSGNEGDLTNNGSSRWRQRAYYDFLKDITSKIYSTPIYRVSIYDTFENQTISKILECKNTKLINDFLDTIRK